MEDKANLYTCFKKYYNEGFKLIEKCEFVSASNRLNKASECLLRLADLSESTSSERFTYKADTLKVLADSLKKAKLKGVQIDKFKLANKSDVKLDDVIGLLDVKDEIDKLIIKPKKYSNLYKRFKKKTSGGILLYGVPGTGKTMIAKAIANEIDAAFYPIKCSDVTSKWFGESEQNIKNLFEQARQNEYAIIFFDEFEAIGCKRGSDCEALNRLVPELLSQIQGIEESTNTLIVIAATNRPWDIDSAFLRSGRFSKSIYVPLPDYDVRKQIAAHNLKDVPTEYDLDFDLIAKNTEGFNSADVVEFCEMLKDEAINRSICLNVDSKISNDDVNVVSLKTHSTVMRDDVTKITEYLKTRQKVQV